MPVGRFIVIEGLDGAGTTTQAGMLRDGLRRRGWEAALTKEPTAGPAGAVVRLNLDGRLPLLDDPGSGRIPSDVELTLLFAADRIDHLNHFIAPQLERGITVISDRYYHSSYAYQRNGVDFDWIQLVNSKAMIPDLTFFLDVPVDVCIKRIARDRFHIEKYEDPQSLHITRGRYLETIKYLQHRGESIIVLDGHVPVAELTKIILANTVKLFSKRQRVQATDNKQSSFIESS